MESRFSKQSKLYAKYRPDYPAELYDFIFSHLNAWDTAWDCATGSGQVAKILANHFKQVYASDISDEQMAHAPRESNIQYFNVPAENSDFPSALFDLITVAQAIHWFDFEKFYEEVRRTAKHGALLAVAGYGRVTVDPKLDKLIDPFYDQMFGQYFDKNRTYLEQKYRSIPFPFYEISTPAFSRTLDWTPSDLEGYLNSWSAVQQYIQDHKSNPVDLLLEKVHAVWQPDEYREVTFPVFLRLGRI
ncbi:class I SAM-dependent methyltransferase [Aliifodinibius sp. S!AR15-10]|uniref:class I SAM-dependent methyltransferase n=1 Tax=Aliifodinibius sp. S!AR15-10 TaxID=2950437 RepID=UPI002862D696|nr:class I SAM-dependent methyltransferase [Aliifodinibius sp. S!AR15-10]MDR8390179.1 class I SAM-dependent methyltransferase [Aliifodinibius sp. S!AR15-10]